MTNIKKDLPAGTQSSGIFFTFFFGEQAVLKRQRLQYDINYVPSIGDINNN